MSYSINAYAKINIGLDVLRKRPDGYHDLKMIMQSVELHDTLTFCISEGDSVNLTCSDPTLPCDSNNLIVRSAELFLKEMNITKSIDIILEKNIPVAAGMAGGSTDAAATFIALNDIFETGLTKDELMNLGVTLGADIPFCIMGGTALSEGIGDILTPLDPPKEAIVLIAKPDISVSTGFVYGNLKLDGDVVHPDIDKILASLSKSVADTGRLLGNILESVTIPAYPVIDDIKKCMLRHGALGSLMSGSGPTVFGLFDDDSKAKEAYDACLAISDNMYCKLTGYQNFFQNFH